MINRRIMPKFKKLIKKLSTDWEPILLDIYKTRRTELKEIEKQIEEEEEKFQPYFEVFPPKKLIFNAFNFFDFDDLKVVIIGQDPYHGQEQAMGLSFSVNKGIKIPPSLVNIYKELKIQYPDFKIPKHGDLTSWAEQGVLLLNASLTVFQGKANSHASLWKKAQFTDDVIQYISDNGDSVIFILWGNFAKQKKKLIDTKKHYILEGGHPSPLSAKYWWNNGHFIKTNEILKDNEKTEINWNINDN